ncbi:coxsackievirus and adenovirus receptor homolog [Mastacembelus armatus]|uniref:coxsackievirus and adenovirus receptor homolog n=1 Tax=Mastacembelus armatus TaxID=205130 RepID=UPI000E456A8F|nr:coxsackievirus and adenovirus receptor homolog [Mastacembelus armatus]
MVCWILLLISLTPFTWGTFVVNVTQSSYQAEENHDITLDWTFTTTAHMSLSAVYIFCQLLTEDKDPVLFHLHEGVEVPESQDKQFSGRVQFDKDVLREGRVRLCVSSLKTNDSGLYWCDVKTEDGAGSDKCLLNVTVPIDEPKSRGPRKSLDPGSRERIGLYAGLGLTAAAVVALLVKLCLSPRFTEPADVSVNFSSVLEPSAGIPSPGSVHD